MEHLSHHEREELMATLDELTAAVTRLADDVGRLVAAVQTPAVDFQPQVDALNAAADQAEAALPPPPAE
jgi:ABC-type transporter Mla subunit MlaD